MNKFSSILGQKKVKQAKIEKKFHSFVQIDRLG
jgi:hypothetical protein